MKTYAMAHTDLKVSRIAYGCLAIGRKWGALGDREALDNTTKVVEEALACGINFFDHADIYAHGRSEELFGAVLRDQPDLRSQMVIQTKWGVRFEDTPTPGMPGRYDFSHAHIVASAEGSLRRLGVEQIDSLVLHRPDPLMDPDDVARAFDDLRAAGKVRYFGVSNFSAGQLALLQSRCAEPLIVNQLQLSLMHHHLINEGVSFNQGRFAGAETTGVLDYCQLHNVRIQPWTPLERGRLFEPPADATDALRAVSAIIATMAARLDTSREAIALGWLLRHPAGFQPIVGTTDRRRLRDCCRADEVDMSREDWYELFNTARGRAVP